MEFKQTLIQDFDKQNNEELLEHYSAVALLLSMSTVVGEEPGKSPIFASLQQEIENSPAGTKWEITFRKI